MDGGKVRFVSYLAMNIIMKNIMIMNMNLLMGFCLENLMVHLLDSGWVPLTAIERAMKTEL